MFKRLMAVMLVAALIVAVGSFVGVAEADEPEGDQPHGYAYAPLSGDETDGVVREVEASSHLASLGCNYEAGGDYPHLSSTGTDASAHGWWEDNSPGQCPEYADVDIILQARMCYYENGVLTDRCYWDSLKRKKKRLRAGTGGSGRRVNVRHNCASTETIGYRSVIDVDLVGVPDGIGKLYRTNNVDCFPAGR